MKLICLFFNVLLFVQRIGNFSFMYLLEHSSDLFLHIKDDWWGHLDWILDMVSAFQVFSTLSHFAFCVVVINSMTKGSWRWGGVCVLFHLTDCSPSSREAKAGAWSRDHRGMLPANLSLWLPQLCVIQPRPTWSGITLPIVGWARLHH